MSDQYYLWLNDQQAGPYTMIQLRSIWNSGAITSETLYWQEGMSEWIALGTWLEETRPKSIPAPPARVYRPEPKKPKTADVVGSFVSIAFFGWILFSWFSCQFHHTEDSSTPSHYTYVPSEPEIANSEWDGSVSQVKDWMRENLKDPDSVQYISWGKVENGPDGTKSVVVKYRAKNSFGGYDIETTAFSLDPHDGHVIAFVNQR